MSSSTHTTKFLMITWPWLVICISILTISLLWPSPFIHTSITGRNQSTMPKSAFQATRLTRSTFLVKEYNDIFSEHPNIYVKLIPSAKTILVIDTGTGGKSNDPDIEVTSLRKFIETVNVAENRNRPLNEGGKMKYVVITTHCHYDHIRTPLHADELDLIEGMTYSNDSGHRRLVSEVQMSA